MATKWKDGKSPRRFAEMSANVQIEISTLEDDVPVGTAQVFVPKQGKHREWREGTVEDDRTNYPDEREYAIHGGTKYKRRLQNAKKKDADGVVVEDDLTALIQMVKEIEGLPATDGDPSFPTYKGLYPGLWLEFHKLLNEAIDLYRQNPNAKPAQSTGRHTFAELLANTKIDPASGDLLHPFWVPQGSHPRERHRLFLDELGKHGSKGEAENLKAIKEVLQKGDNWTGGMQGNVADNGMDPGDPDKIKAAADVVVKLAGQYGVWTLLDGHFRGATQFKPDDAPAGP